MPLTSASSTAAGLALIAGLGGFFGHAPSPHVTWPDLSTTSTSVAPVPPTASDPFPGVSFVTPAPNAKKLGYNTQIQVTFATTVENVTNKTFSVLDAAGKPVPGSVFLAPVYGSAGRENTWVFTASNNFAKNARFTVQLKGITSSGTPLPTASWSFTTGTTYQYAGLY